MNKTEMRENIIQYWMEKASESIDSAKSEKQSGRFSFAVNRAYYACFYSACAVLFNEGEKFRKHSGVRGALHRTLIKPGKIDTSWGKFYDYIFDSRNRADYQEMVKFEADEVEEIIETTIGFVKKMEELLRR